MAAVDSIDVASQSKTHTMHIVIDWSVELGGLPDTSDVLPLDCNVGEHVAVALAVDSTLRSLAAEALVLAGQ